MKSIIGISQLEVFISERGETRDCVDQRLMEFVHEADMIPIQIPTVFTKKRSKNLSNCDLGSWLAATNIAGIILSGGVDIGANPNRDLTEARLLDWSIENRIPVLGICRGMQFMACHLGAKLTQVTGHAGTHHVISDTQTSQKRLVNSFHNLSIEELSEEFFVKAVSEDGSIEQITHSSLLWNGVMWHPEREQNFAIEDQKLIIEFFQRK